MAEVLISGHNQMMTIASELIGYDDANHWWHTNEELFMHKRFSSKTRVFDVYVEQIMRELEFDIITVWVHPHPMWGLYFGVYIVRKGPVVIDIIGVGEEAKALEYLKKDESDIQTPNVKEAWPCQCCFKNQRINQKNK